MSPADSPFTQLPAPGPHPGTDELRAYAAGTLGPAEQHRIEAHALDCERCADLVNGFSMSDTTTTDHAVAALRTCLHARIGAPEPRPMPSRWPRVAAAAALLGVVAGGIWTWEHRDPATPVATARHEMAAPEAATVPATAASDAAPTPPAGIDAATAPSPQVIQQADNVFVGPVAPRRAARRPLPRGATPAAPRQTPPVVLADAEAGAASAAAPENAGLENQAISDSLVVAGTQAPNSANETTYSRATAVDTAVLTGRNATASVASKVKMRSLAPANGQEAARVPATPMPTAPAIKPAPVGGTPAFREYLRRQAAEFVPEDNARPLSGTVRIKFVVGADGKISDLKVTRGLRPDYDQEALRLVCEGPAWQPGISGGRRAPIPVEFSVPF